jgi:hypothetical protein
MRVATKSVSRDGDIKGKYLFARPGGAAYMKGPPPDTKPRKRQYLDPKMMRMAPYPGMARYNAYANNVQIPPRPFEPPTVEVPEDVKDEPVTFEEPSTEVTYPAVDQGGLKIEEIADDGTPGELPTSITEPGDTPGMISTIGNIVDQGLTMVRRTGDALNVVSSYANTMIPYIGYLININQLTAEGGLQMLFGSYADPIISFIRQNEATRAWITRTLSENAIRPAGRAIGAGARAGGTALIRYFLNNPTQVASESLNTAIANTGNLITAGSEFIPTPTIDEVTRTVVEVGSDSPGGMINLIMQVLTMLALRAGIPGPPRATIERLAGTVAGPVSFRGPYALRPRDPATGVVQRAIMDNVARPIQGALARRVGQRLQPPT